uniref:Inactive phospholipase C-like protein 1 n=1 Tax=Sphaerodactylus townsendi TaxID=933632 RepID=A0ACB8FZR3_9SAUR
MERGTLSPQVPSGSGLMGQGDLLKNARNEALENMKQIQLACSSCGLSRTGSGGADAKAKRCLEAIEEKDLGDENGRP